MTTGRIAAIVVVVVAVIVIVPVIIAGFMIMSLQSMPQGAGTVETGIGYMQMHDSTGNISLTIVSGSSRSASSVNYVLYDGSGIADAQGQLSSIANITLGPTHKVSFVDTNGNGYLDVNDKLRILHNAPPDQNPAVSGWKLALKKGTSTLMSVNIM